MGCNWRAGTRTGSVPIGSDVGAIIRKMGQKYWKGFVGMFGAAVSSRLAWKHGPMKISSLGAKIAKTLYERRKEVEIGTHPSM